MLVTICCDVRRDEESYFLFFVVDGRNKFFVVENILTSRLQLENKFILLKAGFNSY